MIQDKEQLESEVLGLRAELQQLQTLSENQKSEIQSLQMLVSGMWPNLLISVIYLRKTENDWSRGNQSFIHSFLCLPIILLY